MLYISHLLSDDDMREVIQQTGAGVESIEFSISENLDHFSETLRQYKRRMQEMGVNDLILHGPFLDLNPAAFDSRIRQVTMERFAQCYEAGRELGAQKIVYHSGMDPQIYFQEGWAERVADCFEEFLLERTDLEVVMENVLDPVWESVKKVSELVRAENFSLCLDIGHAHCYSRQSVLQWSDEMAAHIRHLHVHDNDGIRDAHTALGQGNLPWEKVLKKLPRGEKRTWTIECPRKEDVLQSVKKIQEAQL